MEDPFTKVYIGSNVLHPFYDCSLDLFHEKEKDRIENVFVELDHKQNRLLISRKPLSPNTKPLPLQHAPLCPMRHLPEEISKELKGNTNAQYVR